MKFLRRLCQWSAIALLLALPMLSMGSSLYEAYGAGASHVAQLTNPWELFLYRSFASLFGGFDDPSAVANLFQGGFWSITIFGFTVSDPLALLGHWAATADIHWPLVAGAAAPLALAAIAGRFFCGWVCPVNTLLELNGKLRTWLERWVALPHLAQGMVPPKLRWAILAGGLVISAIAGFNLFAFVLPYAGLARDWHFAVFGGAVGFGVFFMLLLVVVELLLFPRLWCRSLCPTGLVLQTIGQWRALRIRRKPDAICLAGCRACIAACPVAVNPRDEIASERCLACNICVERCPADVLELGILRPRSRLNARGLGTGTALVLALLVLFPATYAAAHHVKGLPHYGYLENYPQTPTRELNIPAAPFDVTVVVYTLEGLDKERSSILDDAMVFVSVTDTRTSKAYIGEIDITFRPTDGSAQIDHAFGTPLEETVYRMRTQLSASTYDVRVRIGNSDGATGEARLSLADGVDPWIIASFAIVVLLLLGLVTQAVRRRRSNSAILTAAGKRRDASVSH